jgi:surfeit locus 1 family protein
VDIQASSGSDDCNTDFVANIDKSGILAARPGRAETPDPGGTTDPGTADLSPFRKVRVSGHFDTTQAFLLDNKIYQGRAGYQVLSPLKLDSGEAILINRGWIPPGEDRTVLPRFDTPATRITITGRVIKSDKAPLQLSQDNIVGENWPVVVQWTDFGQMEKRLGYHLLPYIVLQDPDNLGGFSRDWSITWIKPEKSTSYAVQWFLLAVALLVIYFVVNFKKVKIMTKSESKSRSGRRSLILLAILFSVPLVLAYYMSRHLQESDSFKTKNYGDLIIPPRPLIDVDLKKYPSGVFRLSNLRGKWVMVYIGDASCDVACEKTLYKMRQSRLAQGEELKRINRLYISKNGKPVAPLEKILSAHPGMEVVYGNERDIESLTRQFRKGEKNDAALYLVDPLGNLMMSYPPGFDAKGLIKDLTHLLKASQIG